MLDKINKIVVVGGGLAGSEAAWQCLRAGYRVELREMRPAKTTEAHKGGGLAELVCSNSLKSLDPFSAAGELKHEMQRFRSLILEAAKFAQVPAGQALAVERDQMSAFVETALLNTGRFERVDTEVSGIPEAEALRESGELWIIATGPLTSGPLAESLARVVGNDDGLYFYDAIAPVVDADTIDMGQGFFADRYKDDGDYFNLPLDAEQYHRLIAEIAAAEKVPLHRFEEPRYFESCLPIEVMIERGPETLRFGPLKPVGFTCPKTGRRPHAVVQLRAENRDRTMFSMVGFQTKMKWPEQQRIFRECLPGFAEAEFYRLGSIHRNTYINGPKVLNADLSLRSNDRVFLAGQITGVEGYTESACIGLLAGLNAVARSHGLSAILPPRTTMMGALLAHVTVANPGVPYVPMNCNLGILPQVEAVRAPKKLRRRMKIDKAMADFDKWLGEATEGSQKSQVSFSSVQPSQG